jgi:hypothetical protein
MKADLSLALLRDRSWRGGPRAAAYAHVCLAMNVVVSLLWIAMSTHDVDACGRPLGTGLKRLWGSSKLNSEGTARIDL